MLEWAKAHFQLSVRQPDGRPLREHLEAVESQTGETPAALEIGDLPEGTEYLWEWFCRLSARRQYGIGPSPIGWEGLRAYFAAIGVRPEPWEVRAIEALDNAWLGAQSNGNDKSK